MNTHATRGVCVERHWDRTVGLTEEVVFEDKDDSSVVATDHGAHQCSPPYLPIPATQNPAKKREGENPRAIMLTALQHARVALVDRALADGDRFHGGPVVERLPPDRPHRRRHDHRRCVRPRLAQDARGLSCVSSSTGERKVEAGSVGRRGNTAEVGASWPRRGWDPGKKITKSLKRGER